MQPEHLAQELTHNAKLIRTIISGIQQSEASHKPDPETWSILEVICHLYDEECEDFRQHLDDALHHSEAKWHPIDPGGWVISRQYNERNLNEMLERFLTEREKSLNWLKALSDPDWDAEYTASFGVIRAGDLLSAWAAHDLLHIRQLVELRFNRLTNLTEPYDTRYAGDW